MDIQLTEKQKKIIGLMRDGFKIEMIITAGNRVNKYYMANSRKPMRRRPVIELYDADILTLKSVCYGKSEFSLTELGKTIKLNKP